MIITIVKASNGIHDIYDIEVAKVAPGDLPFLKKIVELIDEENKISIEKA